MLCKAKDFFQLVLYLFILGLINEEETSETDREVRRRWTTG